MQRMNRRQVLTLITGAAAGIAGTVAAIPFIRSLSPAKHVNPPDHGLTIRFPKLAEGDMIAVSPQGIPIYILKRTPKQIDALYRANAKLRDPESLESSQPDSMTNQLRSLKPEIFVAYGLCTHLGCSVANRSPGDDNWRQEPIFNETGGFFCPCHGAVYDAAGRVYKNMPAPKNLRVPDYEFIDETTIRIINKRSP